MTRCGLVLLGCVTLAGACGDDDGPTELPPGPPPTLVAQVSIPENYGIHDTFVRDGLALVLAWDTGVLIYDVGHGIRSGSPANPTLVSSIATMGGQAHNAWWFHNPNTGEKRYLFVGEEDKGTIGATSSGDIHVVDVSDLTNPIEVAFFHLDGAGTHNLWMDEAGEILYAAYYNAGVVALDVADSLQGDLAGRLLWRLAPGGTGNTYTWGVQLANGSLYAIDMLSGLWRLTAGVSAGPVAGGNNIPDRYSSDLWVHGSYAYTATWGFFPRNGNSGDALKIWRVDAGPAPVLVDSVIVPGVIAVSDVQVSDDGELLVFSAEGVAGGVYVYGLADPAHPTRLAFAPVATGVHTVTLSAIGGRLYAFAAKDPPGAALMIFDLTEVVP